MISVYVTSAFSKNNAGGNKAGVVLQHPELTEQQKMEISKELGFSETAFVTDSACADYKLEYFTPTEEVPLCGHATIATFATLHHLGLLKAGDCTIETKAGVLSIHVDSDGLVMMQQNPPQYYEVLDQAELIPCLGGCDVKLGETSQIISTGLKDIIMPMQGVEALNGFAPDFQAIDMLSRAHGVVGIHAFAMADKSSGVDAICRNFAPAVGIDEESATGTASCALAGYFARYIERKEQYIFEQGYSMDLPSRIVVQARYDGAAMTDVYVGGYGYLVEEREI